MIAINYRATCLEKQKAASREEYLVKIVFITLIASSAIALAAIQINPILKYSSLSGTCFFEIAFLVYAYRKIKTHDQTIDGKILKHKGNKQPIQDTPLLPLQSEHSGSQNLLATIVSKGSLETQKEAVRALSEENFRILLYQIYKSEDSNYLNLVYEFPEKICNAVEEMEKIKDIGFNSEFLIALGEKLPQPSNEKEKMRLFDALFKNISGRFIPKKHRYPEAMKKRSTKK